MCSSVVGEAESLARRSEEKGIGVRAVLSVEALIAGVAEEDNPARHQEGTAAILVHLPPSLPSTLPHTSRGIMKTTLLWTENPGGVHSRMSSWPFVEEQTIPLPASAGRISTQKTRSESRRSEIPNACGLTEFHSVFCSLSSL